MSNTIVYAEDWAVKIQERLAEPNKWKIICRVEYTDMAVLHNPYETDATVQSGTRGTAYTMQDIVTTDENIAINTFKILPQIIDRADLAQTTYVSQMQKAGSQGVLLNEAIETAVFADYASMTTFDNTKIGGAAGNITVSAANVDDIIRGIKREVRIANGESVAEREGYFIVWRPADFELLEAFVQANGFSTADGALKDGTSQGFNYMNVQHFSSNKLTAGHLIAGVKNCYHLGIVKSTYGQIVVTQDPLNVSGIGVISRVDFKGKVWHNVKPILFNVTVA